MARRIVWARKALEDLREIHAFIARDSEFYAQTQVQKLQALAEKPLLHPKLGRHLPEFPNQDWRELLCGSYRVIYRHDVEQERILILAIVHTRRLLDPSLVT